MAVMTNALAVKRLAQKIEYLKTKLANPSMDERTLHFATLDITAFELAIEAVRYLDAVQIYEASQQK